MAQKRPHSDPAQPCQFTFRGQTIYQSAPIQDRSSTFIAIYTSSVVFLSSPRVLQQYPGFEDASHRIVAWRRRSNQLGLGFGKVASPLNQSQLESQKDGRVRLETGSDEDGENYAGRKVEAVLERAGVEGVVVVARWYGGVMLGPVRFRWIEDCAREAINLSNGQVPEPKRVKADRHISAVNANGDNDESRIDFDGSKENEKLARMLEARDGSIDVLRSLLSARTEKLDRHQEEEVARSQSPDAVAARHAPVNKLSGKHTTEEKEQSTVEQTSSREQSEKQSSTPREERTINGQRADESDASTLSVEPIAKSSSNYAAMPLERLKQLEKARDATIRWILKQIDAAEEKLQIREEANYKKVKIKAEEIRRQEREEEQKSLRELESKTDESNV